MRILIILFLAAFYFTPLWIVFGIYLTLYFLSAKNRRKSYIESAINVLIRTGSHETVNFQHIYYRAAQTYAIENGAEIRWGDRDHPDNNYMFLPLVINGTQYLVHFHKEYDGSVSISVALERFQYTEIMRRVNSSYSNTDNVQDYIYANEHSDINVREIREENKSNDSLSPATAIVVFASALIFVVFIVTHADSNADTKSIDDNSIAYKENSELFQQETGSRSLLLEPIKSSNKESEELSKINKMPKDLQSTQAETELKEEKKLKEEKEILIKQKLITEDTIEDIVKRNDAIVEEWNRNKNKEIGKVVTEPFENNGFE